MVPTVLGMMWRKTMRSGSRPSPHGLTYSRSAASGSRPDQTSGDEPPTTAMTR